MQYQNKDKLIDVLVLHWGGAVARRASAYSEDLSRAEFNSCRRHTMHSIETAVKAPNQNIVRTTTRARLVFSARL